jgi:hypothetical protein
MVMLGGNLHSRQTYSCQKQGKIGWMIGLSNSELNKEITKASQEYFIIF